MDDSLTNHKNVIQDSTAEDHQGDHELLSSKTQKAKIHSTIV